MRVVVTGAGGQVGRELAERLDGAIALDRSALDVTSLADVQVMVDAYKPDAIVHCAAWTDVDGCEADPERAMRVNGLGPSNLARATAAPIVYLSTDYVFDGTATAPYVESSAPNPLSVYGRSKYAGERALDLDHCAIVRISLVCGRYGRNIVGTILRLLDGDGTLRFVTDQHTRPTMVSDLVGMLERVVAERRTGMWHVTNQPTVSMFEFARAVAEAAGADPERVQPALTADLPARPAPRPANAVLASERLAESELLPDFRESLPRLIADLRG